jgi:hypothetical protein
MKIPKSVSELPKFEQLTEQRARIRKWVAELERVERPVLKSLERVASVMGCSRQTAVRKYYAWKDSEDWHVLINYAKLPYHDKERYRFYACWHKLCLKSKNNKEAFRELERQFKAGKAIPGMQPTESRERLPSGFDYNSLIRHAPQKWIIWRKPANGEKSSSTGCDTEFEAAAHLRGIVESDDAIADIKFKGKSISAKTTLALLNKARLKIVR